MKPQASSTTKRVSAGFFAVSLVGGALVLSTATSASADPPPSTLTPATQTVEYGQNWYLQGTVPQPANPDYTYSDMKVETGGATTTLGDNRVFQGRFNVSDSDFNLTLGIGAHSLVVTFNGLAGVGPSNAAVVTITPAAILATTTIVADPNNSQNAIITSQLSGKYIEQLPNCLCDGQDGYLMPAGTWTMTVTDSNGKTVLSKQLDQPANGLPTFVNYWPSVPAGETFTAQSTFTVASSAKSNFALTSQKFSWTSKKTTTGNGQVSPSSTPKPTTVKTAAFAPPLAVFWAGLLVALILIALDTLLFVQNRRSRTAHTASRTEGDS